ncbi:hypothetical protein [Qipengyuania sp.]|uniref:hypothetical protein n=1 Tax=Qipengyuania sp. TaxID=2004515 RepID=UPI003AF67201
MGISPPMTAAKRPAPISSHPAFAWVVSLYFALLLAVGVFALLYFRNDLFLALRNANAASTALPEGFLGKVLVAGAAAVFGGLIGFVIAQRVIALNDITADIDEPEADEEIPDEEPDNIWLADAAPQKNGSTSSRRSHPLRASGARSEETEGPPPSVNDAPRRPFNPREDLAEEGIAPFLPDADPILLDGEDMTGGLAENLVLQDDETIPGDPYFSDAWQAPFGDSPEAEGAADPLAAAEREAAIAPPPGPDAGRDAEAQRVDTEPAPASDATEQDVETVPLPPAALGDLSLEALTERLAQALESARPDSPGGGRGEEDPVIAFLRREAERDMPATGPGPRSSDPQAELRSALDKLSRVGKRT